MTVSTPRKGTVNVVAVQRNDDTFRAGQGIVDFIRLHGQASSRRATICAASRSEKVEIIERSIR